VQGDVAMAVPPRVSGKPDEAGTGAVPVNRPNALSERSGSGVAARGDQQGRGGVDSHPAQRDHPRCGRAHQRWISSPATSS
jgi:hypothetical protein